MFMVNFINTYGNYLLALGILENIFMIIMIIYSLVYFYKYRKLERILKNGRI